MALLQESIVALRNMRAEMKVDQKERVPAVYAAADPLRRRIVIDNKEVIVRLASLSTLEIYAGRLNQNANMRSWAEFDLQITYEKQIDALVEMARIVKEMERLTKDIDMKQRRLDDEDFRKRAPKDVVDTLAATWAERKIELKKLDERLELLRRTSAKT